MIWRRSVLAGLATSAVATAARSQSPPMPPMPPMPPPPPPSAAPPSNNAVPASDGSPHRVVRSLLTGPARLPADPAILPFPSYWGTPAPRPRTGWVRDRVIQLTRDFNSGRSFGTGLRSEPLLRDPGQFVSEVAAVCQAISELPRGQVTPLTDVEFRDGPWAYSVPSWYYGPEIPLDVLMAQLPEAMKNDWLVASAIRLLKLRVTAWGLEDSTRFFDAMASNPDRARVIQHGRAVSQFALREIIQTAEYFKVADEEYACLLASVLCLDGPRFGRHLTQQDRAEVSTTFAMLPRHGPQAVQASIRPLVEEASWSIVSMPCTLCRQMRY